MQSDVFLTRSEDFSVVVPSSLEDFAMRYRIQMNIARNIITEPGKDNNQASSN